MFTTIITACFEKDGKMAKLYSHITHEHFESIAEAYESRKEKYPIRLEDTIYLSEAEPFKLGELKGKLLYALHIVPLPEKNIV